MLFVELRFFIFFAVVAGCYWSLSDNRARKLLLLVASYLFYAAWNWKYLGLIWFSTVTDYTIGRLLAAMPAQARGRRWLLAASISVNLSLLLVFKYFNFFLSPFSSWTLNVILPAGISFYTFETISYTVDVYRGARPARSLLDFAFFLAFFPHLVAGPILRPSELLPQLETRRRFGEVDVRMSLLYILVGFFKKACVGDNLAIVVDHAFRDPSHLTTLSVSAAVLLWAAQVYCDFSGYSDMAFGLAGLLGYRLVINFDAPYLSGSLGEFWRRWHISLSRFLRDYLYVPLGGNRGSRWRTARNLMITMILGGLWHGAAWRFVLWGTLHGLGLTAERLLPLRLPRWLGVPATFLFCCLGLIIFRCASLGDAGRMFRSLLRWGTVSSLEYNWLALFVVLALVHILMRNRPITMWGRRLPATAFAFLYGVTAALMLLFVQLGYRPFIYFQF